MVKGYIKNGQFFRTDVGGSEFAAEKFGYCHIPTNPDFDKYLGPVVTVDIPDKLDPNATDWPVNWKQAIAAARRTGDNATPIKQPPKRRRFRRA